MHLEGSYETETGCARAVVKESIEREAFAGSAPLGKSRKVWLGTAFGIAGLLILAIMGLIFWGGDQPIQERSEMMSSIAGTLASVTNERISVNDHERVWLFSVNQNTDVYVDTVRQSGLDAIRPLLHRAAIVYFEPRTPGVLNLSTPTPAKRVYVTSSK